MGTACDLAGESEADFIRRLPVVDLHNDRSFFLTARGVPWRRCEDVQICADNYGRAQYFFALFRPPPPYRAGRFGLSSAQARRLVGMSHYAYLKTAIADLRAQTGIPITRDARDLGGNQSRIFLGIEGAFLLDRRPPGAAASGGVRAAGAPEAPANAKLERMLLELKAEGLSYLGLTWSNPNAFAGVAGDKRGLSASGRALLALVRKHGIALDLSHSSDQTVRDVFKLSRGELPLFFSHSSVRALCDHPRNLSDELLELVRASGGVVGINFHAAYISCGGPAERADVRRHVQYIVERFGYRHVALGGDFDGLIQLPEGLGGPPDLYALARDLRAAGLSRNQIEAIFFRNVRRVLTEVQKSR